MGKWDIPAKHEITDTELRFNPYHDPQNGRFTDGSGGAGSYLYVGNGMKGQYAKDREEYGKEAAVMMSDSKNFFTVAAKTCEDNNFNYAYNEMLDRYKSARTGVKDSKGRSVAIPFENKTKTYNGRGKKFSYTVNYTLPGQMSFF